MLRYLKHLDEDDPEIIPAITIAHLRETIPEWQNIKYDVDAFNAIYDTLYD